ncbi:unnamed protein product, partial [marine sediment metagenome]
MPKIEHILSSGPELAESQRLILEILEKHSDYLFRMNPDDLRDLQAWLTKPEAPEPPESSVILAV